MTKYEVFACALGKFTASNNNKSTNASRRDYRVFDTKEEAQAWADEKNRAQEARARERITRP